MNGLNILVIPGLTLADVSAEQAARIRAVAGDDGNVMVCTPDEAFERAREVDVILGVVPPRLLAAAPRLAWVQSISSGVDSFMYPEFVASPVTLTSEKGLVGEHLADHGFGLLLMMTRQLARARDLGTDSWNSRWELRREEVELTGLHMGIIGFGGTGRAMARRGGAFGLRIRAVDRDPVPGCDVVAAVESTSALDDVLGWSDVLAICCPLTVETRDLIDAARLARLKPGAFIVNVTRGEIIDEAALIAALKSGHVRGAGLDVAPREPLPVDSELWQLPNVVMTPHTAGASQYRAERNLERFITNVVRFRKGAPLEGVIDKTLGY